MEPWSKVVVVQWCAPLLVRHHLFWPVVRTTVGKPHVQAVEMEVVRTTLGKPHVQAVEMTRSLTNLCYQLLGGWRQLSKVAAI